MVNFCLAWDPLDLPPLLTRSSMKHGTALCHGDIGAARDTCSDRIFRLFSHLGGSPLGEVGKLLMVVLSHKLVDLLAAPVGLCV